MAIGAALFTALTLMLGLAGAASASALPVVHGNNDGGWAHGMIKPGNIYLGGLYGNAYVGPLAGSSAGTLKWSHWTGTSAYGRGLLEVNLCRPDCAAGHYARYAASVTLRRPEVHRGVRYFSRLTLRYFHGYQRSYTYKWKSQMWVGGP